MGIILALLLLPSVVLAGTTLPPENDQPSAGEESPLYAAPTRIDRIGRIVAPVMINGQGPFRLVVDTGASISAFSPELAKRLGLELSQVRTTLLHGVTGSSLVHTVSVEHIRAGEVLVEGQQIPVLWSSIMADADGILGVAGFRNERIQVDFKRDRILISKSRGRRAAPGFLTIRAKRVAGGLLVVDAKVGGVRTKAIIDTGAERTLGNRALRNALLARTRNQRAADQTSVYGATPHVSAGELLRSPAILLGEAGIAEIAVTYGDFHVFDIWGFNEIPALVIGMDVLGTLDALTIDYRLRELHIRV